MRSADSVVYIVDDDISVRESLEGLILEAGWQPSAFASASDFLASPPAASPNCLVLDVSLPDLNGLDLQQMIAGERADMPIIFITGYGDVPMSVRAMKAGAVEFLTKPFGGRGASVRNPRRSGAQRQPAGDGGGYAVLAVSLRPPQPAASARSWRWSFPGS